VVAAAAVGGCDDDCDRWAGRSHRSNARAVSTHHDAATGAPASVPHSVRTIVDGWRENAHEMPSARPQGPHTYAIDLPLTSSRSTTFEPLAPEHLSAVIKAESAAEAIDAAARLQSLVFAGPDPRAPAHDFAQEQAIVDKLAYGPESAALGIGHVLPELELRGFLARGVATLIARAAAAASARGDHERADLLANITFAAATLTTWPSALDQLRHEAPQTFASAAGKWRKKFRHLRARASVCSAAKLRCVAERLV
jgi:hypothetical protein